jgi:glucose/arabinose dehydrogenase
LRPLLLVACLAVAACSSGADAPKSNVDASAHANRVVTSDATARVVVVAGGLDRPWGIAFLPDQRALVTEKRGRLRIVTLDGRVGEPIGGVPKVHAVEQGGLLDVAIDPQFASNRYVYLSYAEPREGGAAGTSVARARLAPDDRELKDLKVIFRQQPSKPGGHHFGSRLVFARDGRLFVTLGERNQYREFAQTLDTHLGKVVRIESDGRVPADNPFVSRGGALPEIWSYGHRNVQGAALNPTTGELWIDEHGPRGGDELNIDRAGRNYGWPAITYGREYSGGKVSDYTERPGMEQPVHYWVPSIATSGLMFYTGDKFPQWRGNAFVGGLKSQSIARLELDGDKVVREERLFEGKLRARVRELEQGPDGMIYVLTDELGDALLRIEPAD